MSHASRTVDATSPLPTLGKPLICYGQPDPDYRAMDALSQSAMTELLKSPAHFMARFGPQAEPFIPTPSMLMGTALHARVLEPETFDAQFCSREDFKGEPLVAELQELLTAQGIEFKKSAKKPELLALAFPDGVPQDKRTAFSADDFGAVLGMAEALRTHDIAGNWFDPGQKDYRKHCEVSVYSLAPSGQLLKARLDRLHIDPKAKRITLLDLKTTDDASKSHFQRKAHALSYDLQAHWYSRLTAEAFPDYQVEFIFVVVERRRPHGIQLFRASEALLMNGARKMDQALALHAACTSIGHWSGYDPVIQDLDMPAWGIMEEDQPCLF